MDDPLTYILKRTRNCGESVDQVSVLVDKRPAIIHELRKVALIALLDSDQCDETVLISIDEVCECRWLATRIDDGWQLEFIDLAALI